MPKYSVPKSKRWELQNDIELSTHAMERWDERTPSASVSPEIAWERGEDIRHPELLDLRRLDGCYSRGIPDRVRVYRDDSVAAVFVVNEHVVATIYSIDGIGHGPTRAYLHAHGPHGGDSG